MPDKIVIYAPAKINLFLKILSKREDGYHNIRSGITFINLFDEIEIKQSNKTTINYSGFFRPDVGYYKNCIIEKILKTISLLKNNHLNITVKKNIPVQAGLGAASTNAAGLIKGLQKLQLIKTENYKQYVRFGADVPCFLFEKDCLVRGIGDLISREHFPKYFFLLVKPKVNLSTKEMYSVLNSYIPKNSDEVESHEINENDYGNDFEKIAIQKFDEIREILSWLNNINQSIFANMTGSGSGCYAVFETKKFADQAQKEFIRKFPDLWNFVAENNIINDYQ